MSLKHFLSVSLIGLLLLTPFAALAQDDAAECGLVTLIDGWVRPAGEGMPNSAAYGVLVNLTDEPDTLLAVSTAAAAAVELHEMTMDGDVMRMSPIEGGIAVAPYGFAELAPGGLHIMLIGLVAPLEADTTLELVLTFAHAGDVTVTVPVTDRSTEQSDMHETMPTAAHHTGGHMATPADTAVDTACAGIYALGAWARPAGAGMPNSAAYMLLLNLTDTDDTLVAAASEAAGAVELHEMTMDGDVMRMSPIVGGITVPAGGSAMLTPGGLHIMLIDLTQALMEGEAFDLTLTFEHAGDYPLSVPIGDPTNAAPHMRH